MKTITLTIYECMLLTEALTRAAARRNSMSKAAEQETKQREHSETANDMIKLLARLRKVQEAA